MDFPHNFFGAFDESVECLNHMVIVLETVLLHHTKQLVDHGMRMCGGMSYDRMELINQSVMVDQVVDLVVLHVHVSSQKT